MDGMAPWYNQKFNYKVNSWYRLAAGDPAIVSRFQTGSRKKGEWSERSFANCLASFESTRPEVPCLHVIGQNLLTCHSDLLRRSRNIVLSWEE